jgi:hypothetical protein
MSPNVGSAEEKKQPDEEVKESPLSVRSFEGDEKVGDFSPPKTDPTVK